MKKIVLGAVLVLLVSVGVGVYFLLSNLDGIVKSAIETYGSQATQTAVRVDRVKIGLKTGSGAITGLTVGNPQGFKSPEVFFLGEISTQIDLKSLSGDLLVIDHIRVIAPEVFFELNQAGKTNLDQLKQNLASSTSASSSASKKSGPEPKIRIRELLFTDGHIHVKVVPLNKDYDVALPTISMKDLGGQNGATPTQIADQVVKLLTDQALAEVKKQGIDQYKKQLEGKVNKRIDAETQKIEQKINDKVGKDVGGQIGGALKGLLNK
ncbi:hypothetical protein [Geopsychrobacter electrodiphilus]|uniref:DUF748 domain-containing protein n=1 Tax=Geopsychrobacter electrodiphilus TaxID=225196 RepID=UPI0003654C05|nr:hypothetical protein [Geopsychrobacter electrodiphilus]